MNDDEASPVRAEDGVAEARAESDARTSAPVLLTDYPPGEQSAAACDEGNHEGVQQDKHEENAMIEVHAPHGGLNTWKDFWTHLGTITLGLLIAVGLEQSVEWMHHMHQRHQLEEDLNAEAERNHTVITGDIENGDARRGRLFALRDEVNRMRDSGGRLKLEYILDPTRDPRTSKRIPPQVMPSGAAWATAKESQMVALLPHAEAEMYSRLDVQHDRLTEVVQNWLQEQRALQAFEKRFEDADSQTPDMTRMSVAQLEEYSTLLSNDISGLEEIRSRLKNFDLESEAIRHGARTEEDVIHEATK